MSQPGEATFRPSKGTKPSVLRLQGKLTFSQLSDPAGPLQPPSVWISYKDGVGKVVNTLYNDRRKLPSVTVSTDAKPENIEETKRYLKQCIARIDFAPPASESTVDAPSLQQRLQFIAANIFEPILLNPPAGLNVNSLYRPKLGEDLTDVLLLSPSRNPRELKWGLRTLEWATEAELQRMTMATTLSAANALLHLYARSLGEGHRVDIVQGNDLKAAYPQLHDARNRSLQFAIITGEPSSVRRFLSHKLRL